MDERQLLQSPSGYRTAIRIDPDKVYSLAELVDLAEAHNPETRVVWESVRDIREDLTRGSVALSTMQEIVPAALC